MTTADRIRTDSAARAALARAPLRIDSDNLVERPWGGARLIDLKQLPARNGRFGESFEVSADPSDPEAARHPSWVVFEDGSRIALPELLELAGAELLGPGFVTAHGARLPLLPKFLAIEGLLSVQTHPPNHPEMYVVVEAEPGTTLRLGWKGDVDQLALARELADARKSQERWIASLPTDVDFDAIQACFTRNHDQPERLRAELRSFAGGNTEPGLDELVADIATAYFGMLDRMNAIAIAPGDVIWNACPSVPIAETVPSAEIHALGDPAGKRALLFEVRCPGITHRAWDHMRFPIRPLQIPEAMATMSARGTGPDQFRTSPRPIRLGVRRSVDCPAFIVDHLDCPVGTPVETTSTEMPSTLHALRGEVELVDLDLAPVGRLRAGESMLLPAGLPTLRIHATDPASLLQVTIPIGPERPHLHSHPLAKRRNWSDLRRIVTRSEGPSEVLAIVNGGDGPAIARHLESLATHIFRVDGRVRIDVHEESERRGQLLGLLDALRDRSLDPDRVALGIMLPGKGTRLSPLTQRLGGIKPLMPVPIRPDPTAPWLDAASASLYSWVGVGHMLERLGFRGVAWKWGDEPQIPEHVLAWFDRDLSGVDAVRFGAAVELDEDLARNKEWLALDPIGDLRVQVRRRPLAELVARLGTGRAHVNLGSPAFSHRFLAAAEQSFGDCGGWLDVDGYLFEALTHDPETWAMEVGRDADLRALLARTPDFYARAARLRSIVEAERGHPIRIAVIDFGAELHWADVGQLAKLREVYAALAADGETGAFARLLAGIGDVEPDRWGNRVSGDASVPDDGAVRGCVVIDSHLRGTATRAVVLRSTIGQAVLGAGSVALDCDVANLELGADAFAFRSELEQLVVAPGFVHTSIPSDPSDPHSPLDSWSADSRANPGAPDNYDRPAWGNPTSFAAKYEQMRRR